MEKIVVLLKIEMQQIKNYFNCPWFIKNALKMKITPVFDEIFTLSKNNKVSISMNNFI